MIHCYVPFEHHGPTLSNPMFGRKKSQTDHPPPARMRGPENARRDENSPLARRVRSPLADRVAASGEPDTVDLKSGVKVPESVGSGEPETKDLGAPPAEQAAAAPRQGLVTGFLVIIDGPGQGEFAPVSEFVNSVGAGAEQSVRLDFGDDAIASVNQCLVTYDAADRVHTLHHGGGAEPTRLNDETVREPARLRPGDRIGLGRTTLMFVPVCGDGFGW